MPCPENSSSAACSSAFASDAPRRSPCSSSSRWRARQSCKPRDALVVDPLRGLPDGEPLQDGARLQDLDRLVVARHGGRARRGAARGRRARPARDGSAPCAPRRATCRTTSRVGLDEARVRRDVAAHDGVAERVVARVWTPWATHTAGMLREIVNNSVFIACPPRTRTALCAVLGLGEAGAKDRSRPRALRVSRCAGYDPAVAAVPDGVVRVGDPASAVAGGSVVLAATTAATARAAAEAVLPGLGPDAVYADLNTAAPALKRELAASSSGAGARFADVALLGPVPARARHARARIGPGATRSPSSSGRSGCRSRCLPGGPGDAAAREAPALGLHEGPRGGAAREPRGGARRPGTTEWLEREIAADHRRAARSSGCSRAAERHAVRRVDELEAARELLRELGVEPRITRRARPLARRAAAARIAVGWSRRGRAARRTPPSERARDCSSRARTTSTSTSRPTCPRGGSTTSRSRAASPSSGSPGSLLKSHYTSTAERAQVVVAAAFRASRCSGRSRSTAPSAG